MASKFGLAGGIPERRVRPIWDAIDTRQFKSAHKQVTTLLTKYPNSPYALALKALVIERMGKPDEALSVCSEAKDLLYKNDSVFMDDLTLSTLQIVFQRLNRLDMATSCYEYACGKFPNNIELMMGLFNCYVREYSFVKQQQTAIKMYKLFGEERFLLWAVCSIQLQVLCGNGGEKLLLLAEGLLKKHVTSHSLHDPEALIVYLSILEQQGKYSDALEILSGNLGSLLMIEVDKLRIQGRLLARSGDYSAAASIFQKILETCPDDWECFLHYLGSLLEDDSCWCSDAKNDPIHLPRIVNCKISDLSDEQFDTRLLEASTFIQKLLTVSNNNSPRGSYLANIEIERRKHLNGKGDDDKLMEALLQYFHRFGQLACFTSDIEMFVDILTSHKKSVLLEKLTAGSESLSAVPVKKLGMSITLFKVQQLIGDISNPSVTELELFSVQMAEMFCKNLHLSRDLDPQESVHGEELLSLTCNILVKLFWRTNHVGYLVEAIMILEFGLSIRSHVWQYKILLLHLYSYVGALTLSYKWYKSLDVKNILMETLSHHILPQMLVSPLWVELNGLLKEYLKFMDDHLRESADLTFLAYRHRNYSKVIEFVQFKERLQHSCHYLMARFEDPILQLKQNVDKIEEAEGVLESLKCGTHLLELYNEIGLKSLTFNEDLQARPWWTPTSEKNYLFGPWEEISYQSTENLKKEKEAASLRDVEKKSLLPRMLYLSIQNASASSKEHVEANGSPDPKLSAELKLLLERYAKTLGFSFSEAVEIVSSVVNGDRSSMVFGSDAIDWLSFTVFLNAWKLTSRDVAISSEDGSIPQTWKILDGLFKQFISEKMKSLKPDILMPLNAIQVLVQIVTEPLAWHGLVIQSYVRSSLPSGKKKKKSGHTEQSNLNLLHAIKESIQLFHGLIEDVTKWIREWINRSEDENMEAILSNLQTTGQNETPGKVFHILTTFISSTSESDLDQISHLLKSWSSADVARNLVTSKTRVLTEFLKICESRIKLYQAVKVQIAQIL